MPAVIPFSILTWVTETALRQYKELELKIAAHHRYDEDEDEEANNEDDTYALQNMVRETKRKAEEYKMETLNADKSLQILHQQQRELSKKVTLSLTLFHAFTYFPTIDR